MPSNNWIIVKEHHHDPSKLFLQYYMTISVKCQITKLAENDSVKCIHGKVYKKKQKKNTIMGSPWPKKLTPKTIQKNIVTVDPYCACVCVCVHCCCQPQVHLCPDFTCSVALLLSQRSQTVQLHLIGQIYYLETLRV